MKLYRFASPIQLQPLQENPNSRSEEGSLYYSAVDSKVKLRESNSWEDLATVKYVDAQDFGADHVALTNLSNTDLVRWDSIQDSWVNEAALQVADTTANGIIATNSSGLLDQTFLHYHIDRQNFGFFNLPEPLLESEVTTKSYVDSQEFGAYNVDIIELRNNDFMRFNDHTGKWQNVMAVYEAAPESERWDEIISTNPDGFLDKSFLQYNIDMNGHTFYNLLEPTEDGDAATKNYCDSQDLGANNVSVTNASDFDHLQYDQTIGKWVNVSGFYVATDASEKSVYILDDFILTATSESSVSLFATLSSQDVTVGTSVLTVDDGFINIHESFELHVTDASCSLRMTPSGILQQATKWSKAAPGQMLTDASKHLVEIYDTDIAIPSGQTGHIATFAFPVSQYAGSKVEYRLKNSGTGDVRVGTLYVSVNGDNASLTDFYTETDSLNIGWSASVVMGVVRLEYTNGSGDKLFAMDTKYFPH